VLLHGDFLDKNLLLGPAGYIAIDPMPRVGDPCAEVGFFAACHPPGGHIAARAHALAGRLGLDETRSARWAAVWAVGEACETWREDSDEVMAWVRSEEAARLLTV
jgi:streptomycin 6-kinase